VLASLLNYDGLKAMDGFCLSEGFHMRTIENYPDFDFITRVFVLISQNRWNNGAYLRDKIKQKHREVRHASERFADTWDKPCGYQDAAAERCVQVGQECMQMIHAYLACKYGALPRRLSVMLDNTLVEEV
jgi:hypothetical protein